jgi:hypothetical protein
VAGKMAYPLPGALLPYNRIIAFTEIYTRMGILEKFKELK